MCQLHETPRFDKMTHQFGYMTHMRCVCVCVKEREREKEKERERETIWLHDTPTVSQI